MLKNIIALSFLIIAFSFAYYLVIFIPNKEKTRQEFENKKIEDSKTQQIYQIELESVRSQDLKDCTKRISDLSKTQTISLETAEISIKYCMQGKGYSDF